MQVTETRAEGLKYEFKVVVPAADLESKVDQRLFELKDQVQLRGFRPGKVPVSHLKRVYGKAALAEVLEAIVREANAKIVNDRGLRLAAEPKVTFPSEQAEVEAMFAGRGDLSYSVAIEVLPPIKLADFKDIVIERPVAEVTPADIDEAVQKIADQSRPYADKPEGAKAEQGDRLTINFTGRIDGAPFESGTGENLNVELGSGTFIPGFEDQLIGAGAGEERQVKIAFPVNYANPDLAGKAADFDVQILAVKAPGKVIVDEEFAKSLGVESLAKLRDAVRERLRQDHANASRQKVKRSLLDQLDAKHKFELPPSMVEEEFENLWKTVKGDLDTHGRTFADEGTTEEAARVEYRSLAERRVRLGLVLAEIGQRNNISVSDDEVSRAAAERASQFRGQEQQVWEYYRKNPSALASLRAPLFEDKVVNFITELATVNETKVSREELYKDGEEPQPAA